VTSHDLNDTLSRPTPIPTENHIEGQNLRVTEVKIRSTAPRNRNQPSQEDKNVLASLRNGWISEYETAPSSQRQRPVRRGMGIGGNLKTIAAELELLLEGFMSLLREMLASIARGALAALMKDATGPALIGMFAIMIAIGGLVYVALVDNIFGQGQPSSTAAADPPAATAQPPVSTPVAESAQAAATPAAPADDGSGQPASTFFRLPPQGSDARPSPIGTLGLPANFADSDRASALTGPSSPADGGDLLGMADSQPAQRIARKEVDTPVQRDQPATAHANTAYATPVSGTSAGVASSARSITADQPAQQRKAYEGFRQSAARTATTDPRTLAALESAQRMAAGAAGHGDVEGTAFAAIAHGGRAVFEVQHLRASTGESCPARIIVTATSLAFAPDAACETDAWTIPLASVTSVETGQIIPETVDANALNIEFNDRAKSGSKGRLSVRVSSRRVGADAAQPTPVTHIRNVIVAVQQPSSTTAR